MKKEDFEKIEHYINEQADDNEIRYVESLLMDGETNLYLRNRLEADWGNFIKENKPTNKNLGLLLEHIHHLIIKQENEKRNKTFHKISRIYARVAAILFIPILISGGLIFSYISGKKVASGGKEATAMIYAPLGSRVAINLPDGSKGMLNSGSKIKYSIPFTENRHIELEGEVWLDVKHDVSHPLEISAGKSKVKVLGTTFNMSAYPDESYIEVVLQEGKVEFQGNTEDDKITLLPSERLVSLNGKTSKSKVDPRKYNAWTDGYLVFRGDPMAEVARRIERWYNIEIKLASKDLEKYSFRATFQDEQLEDVLKLLAMTSPITYLISPGELLPDGKYKKEVVTIYKKE